jgi:Leu/Phe-tRNA-protein transferase
MSTPQLKESIMAARESHLRTENPLAEQVCAAYSNGSLGLVECGELVGHSRPWVRAVLVANGITVRGRGRPVTAKA